MIRRTERKQQTQTDNQLLWCFEELAGGGGDDDDDDSNNNDSRTTEETNGETTMRSSTKSGTTAATPTARRQQQQQQQQPERYSHLVALHIMHCAKFESWRGIPSAIDVPIIALKRSDSFGAIGCCVSSVRVNVLVVTSLSRSRSPSPSPRGPLACLARLVLGR